MVHMGTGTIFQPIDQATCCGKEGPGNTCSGFDEEYKIL